MINNSVSDFCAIIRLLFLNFAVDRLKDNQERLDQLEEEKKAISEHAHELESTIHDLVSQKEMTEKELRVRHFLLIFIFNFDLALKFWEKKHLFFFFSSILHFLLF